MIYLFHLPDDLRRKKNRSSNGAQGKQRKISTHAWSVICGDAQYKNACV